MWKQLKVRWADAVQHKRRGVTVKKCNAVSSSSDVRVQLCCEYGTGLEKHSGVADTCQKQRLTGMSKSFVLKPLP